MPLHGYSATELDRLIVNAFLGYPSEPAIARLLGIPTRDVSAAIERFTTKVAELADKHWRRRILALVEELVVVCDRLGEIDPPVTAAVGLRVRAAARWARDREARAKQHNPRPGGHHPRGAREHSPNPRRALFPREPNRNQRPTTHRGAEWSAPNTKE